MSFHGEQLKELRALLAEELKSTSEIVTLGIAIKDFASYKEHVGRLYAYKRSLELIEEAAEKVEKRE